VLIFKYNPNFFFTRISKEPTCNSSSSILEAATGDRVRRGVTAEEAAAAAEVTAEAEAAVTAAVAAAVTAEEAAADGTVEAAGGGTAAVVADTATTRGLTREEGVPP